MKVSKFEAFNMQGLCDSGPIITELNSTLSNVDLESCRTHTIGGNSNRTGTVVYSPIDMNAKISDGLIKCGWTTNYKCPKIKNADRQTIDDFCKLSAKEKEKSELKRTYSDADFYKELSLNSNLIKIILEVQFGKYTFMTSDCLFKIPLFRKNGISDLGIELVPIKKVAKNMSTGPGNYEKTLIEIIYADIAHPLLLVGIE
jgi:hypothetical protein